MKETKPVDAVAMVRKIRDAHYERLENKSVAERLAFYREESRKLRNELGEEKKANSKG
jgi:hypothetical protein